MKLVSVVSDLCVDIIIRGNVTPRYNQAEQLVDDYEMELGGSAAIFASQYAKLGGKVDLYGLLGKDLFGEYLHKRLSEQGVNSKISFSAQTKTSLGLGLIRGADRAMLTFDGSMRDLRPDDIFTDDFFSSTGHLHICSYFLLPQFQEAWPWVIRRLRDLGATISLDTNWSPGGNWERVLDILPMVDVFLPNEQEAINISNESSVRDAGEWLALHGPLVVIKCGADGARAFEGKNEWSFAIPGEWTTGLEIADTTGAGDNFDGGFMYAWLQGRQLGDCVRLGLRCGTFSLKKMGGIEGQVSEIHTS